MHSLCDAFVNIYVGAWISSRKHDTLLVVTTHSVCVYLAYIYLVSLM